MVLAAAETLQEQGFDPGLHMLVSAVDLSPLCFHMTYIQLALRGIPAFVEHGNTLTLERFAGAWTPAVFRFFERHGRLFPAALPTGPAEVPAVPGEQFTLF
jgi:hypothetical protein